MKDYLEASKDAFLNSFISFPIPMMLYVRVFLQLCYLFNLQCCIRHKSFVQFFDLAINSFMFFFYKL